MTLTNILELFPPKNIGASNAKKSEQEQINLEEFERGYQAGWDDSAKAYNENVSNFSAELKDHLLNLSFTYQDAKSEILSGLEPLLAQLGSVLLPKIAHAGFAHYLTEQISDVAEKMANPTVTITVHPTQIEALKAIANEDLDFPFLIIEDDSVQENTAHLKFKTQEIDIDLSECLAGIENKITALCTTHRKVKHG